MKDLIKQIEDRIIELQKNPCLVNIGKVSELNLVKMKLKQLLLHDVVVTCCECEHPDYEGDWNYCHRCKKEID